MSAVDKRQGGFPIWADAFSLCFSLNPDQLPLSAVYKWQGLENTTGGEEFSMMFLSRCYSLNVSLNVFTECCSGYFFLTRSAAIVSSIQVARDREYHCERGVLKSLQRNVLIF